MVWVRIGLTMRAAQTFGLHRDGSPRGLSPFEVEMRRRVWFALCAFDRRVSQVPRPYNIPTMSTFAWCFHAPWLAARSMTDISLSTTVLQTEGASDDLVCPYQSKTSIYSVYTIVAIGKRQLLPNQAAAHYFSMYSRAVVGFTPGHSRLTTGLTTASSPLSRI